MLVKLTSVVLSSLYHPTYFLRLNTIRTNVLSRIWSRASARHPTGFLLQIYRERTSASHDHYQIILHPGLQGQGLGDVPEMSDAVPELGDSSLMWKVQANCCSQIHQHFKNSFYVNCGQPIKCKPKCKFACVTFSSKSCFNDVDEIDTWYLLATMKAPCTLPAAFECFLKY